MKKKNIAIAILCAIIFIPLVVLAVDFGNVEFSLNFQKYHSFEIDELTFDFYGSFGSVRKVVISDSSGNIDSLKISADADIYDEKYAAVELCDLNGDKKSDLLILCSIDDDGDVHRSLFLYSHSSYRYMSDVDAVNFQEKNGTLVCEEKQLKYLAETVEEYTVPYELSWIQTTYEYSEGAVIPTHCYKLSFYSETQMYCFGEWGYDSDIGELVSISEDWMDKKEYTEKYQYIDGIFEISIN